MKSLVLSLAAFGVAAAAAAAPIDGMWATPTDNGVVEITQCDGGVCGQIVTGDKLKADPAQADVRNDDASLRARHLKGLYIFRGMTGGPTEWTGKVYNPKDGHTYSGKITMHEADKLNLRGCVVFPLCKTEVWTRLH